AAYTTYEENLKNLRALPGIAEYLWENRGDLPALYFRNLRPEAARAFRSPVSGAVLSLPSTLLGLRSLIRQRKERPALGFLALTLLPAFTYHPLTVVDLRYLLPLLPAAL